MAFTLSGPVLGLVLTVIGVLGLWRCPDGLGVRFSEALLISGILSLTVDLYLKRKLQEDTAKDIFHHLLGVNLPEELKDKLHSYFFDIRTYSKNATLQVNVESPGDGVKLTVTASSTIVATSASSYRQGLWFEESEDPEILEASLTSTAKPTISYTCSRPRLQKKKDEPAVLGWQGDEINMNKGDELSWYAKFVVRQQGRSGFWVHNFGTPTLHPRLRIESTDGVAATASTPDQLNGTERVYNRAFLVGDHIQVRWTIKR